MSKKELEIPKFTNKDQLADFLKATLRSNDGLLKGIYANCIADQINELYDDEADVDYEDSYEDSSC